MPLRLNDSTDWNKLAEETRALAKNERDPAVTAWLQGIIREYERLAKRCKPSEEDAA